MEQNPLLAELDRLLADLAAQATAEGATARLASLERARALARQLGGAAAAPARQRAERMFPPDEVAREVGVAPEVITAWCQQGLLRSDGADPPRVPASALHAYRESQPRWRRLDAVASAARDGAPEPAEDAIFAELAARRG